MSDDTEVLETSKNMESEALDLESLLVAVNSKNFSPSTGLVEEPVKFEKVDSFFELVKDKNNEANTVDDHINSIPEDIPISSEDVDKNETDQDKEVGDTSVELFGDETENAKTNTTEDELAVEPFDKQEATRVTHEVLDEELNSSSEITDRQKISDDFDDENKKPTNLNDTESMVETAAFDRGYQSAISEFEKSMELEKTALADLGSVLFRIENNLKDNLSKMLKKNIIKLSSEFIGSKIDEMPEQFVSHIHKCAEEIFFEAKEIKVRMNHYDFELINSILGVNDLNLRITESPDLRRGEFELSYKGSGLKQKFAD
tara:strand:- start:526 stop:1473 length:948 start_codon:yes stop_codon:yes gene_type:complete